MDQGMNYQGTDTNTFAFNGVGQSMPSTTEHRSVLVSRKFINGLVANYNKTKVNADNGFVAPSFEMPSFEVPKFDFSNQGSAPTIEATPVSKATVSTPETNVELPKAEPISPIEVAPQQEVNVEMPKFDFSSLLNNVAETPKTEEKAPEVTPIVEATPVVKEDKKETSNDDNSTDTTSDNEGGVSVSPIEIDESDKEILAKYANIDGISTETMLFEVQSTLNSLANMVSVLTQQRTDLLAQQEEIEDANEALDKREEAISLKERTVEEKEAANELQRQEIEKLAADNAKQLSERTLALKAKAQELEDKERAYQNRLDELNKNIEKNVEDAKSLKKRAEELNAKEAELDKLSVELKGRLNNLVDAENKFKVIVKEFNDTVNFNNTLNSIATPVKQLKKELNEEKAA